MGGADPPPEPKATWITRADVAITCTPAEFMGAAGAMTAEACLAAAEDRDYAGVDYAVWRGDSNEHCYECKLAGRGAPSTWHLNSLPGAVSFIRTAPPQKEPHTGPDYWFVNAYDIAVEARNYDAQALLLPWPRIKWPSLGSRPENAEPFIERWAIVQDGGKSSLAPAVASHAAQVALDRPPARAPLS